MHKACKHLKYQTLQSRLDSFDGWPGRFVPKTPEELSAAGFFYIGSADRVTCFQCGITLRDWEVDHDPVTEHRRYSQHCQFINCATPSDLGVSERPMREENNVAKVHIRQQQNDNGLEKIMNDLHLGDEACAPFSSHPSQITNDSIKASVDGIAYDNQEDNQDIAQESKTGKVSKAEYLRRENLRLRKETLCRTCRQQTANTLFLPCGHLLTCAECGGRTERCNSCGKEILGTVKTYRI